MKTRNGLFADVPEEQWNDWHWQVRNRAETLDDLKKIMTLTPDEEEGVKKTLGKLRMAITPYYLSLIDLDDPYDPIRKMAIPRAEELEYADYEDADPLHEDTDSQRRVSPTAIPTACCSSSRICAPCTAVTVRAAALRGRTTAAFRWRRSTSASSMSKTIRKSATCCFRAATR